MASSHHRHLRSARRPKANVEFAVAVRCRHCGLNYRAHPLKAVCPKCKCRANRALPRKLLLAYGLMPPIAWAQSLLLYKEAPFAAFQALTTGTFGATLYAVIYFIAVQLFR